MTIKNIQDVVSKHYDLAFIGSGASTSYSIISLCAQYVETALGSLSVIVIEASSEFNSGVAYGPRSGDNALILTRLAQFYPPDELLLFASWVRQTGCENEVWSDDKHDDLAKLSLTEYAMAMGSLCIRRRLVGEFIAWRVKQALASLPSDSGLSVHFVTAKASGVRALSNDFDRANLAVELKSSTDHSTSVGECRVGELVLAVGTRPRAALPIVGVIPHKLSQCILNDPYDGEGLDANHASMMRGVHSLATSPIAILVLGSNASAMESLYLLSKWSQTAEELIKIVVISTIGEFPARIPDVMDNSIVDVSEITDYAATRKITSDGLYAAALKGLKRLKIQGKSLDCYNSSIDLALLNALNIMDKEVRLEFLREKCNLLGRFKRRAEKHYHDTMTSLQQQGKLTALQGRVNSVSVKDGRIVAQVESSTGELQDIYADGLINCGASEPLSPNSSNPVIASLVDSGLAEVDISGACFKTINGGFQISKNIHVIGPLLAGNVVNGEPVWHLEHCGRIIRFSNAITKELLEAIEQAHELEEA